MEAGRVSWCRVRNGQYHGRMAERRSGKGDAGSALRRQWVELKFLAEARSGKTVVDLLEHVRREGFAPSRRTVERDLADLKELFPLNCVGEQPQTWYFDRKAPKVIIPGLSAHEALSFLLVEERLGVLLPGTTREHLQEHFAAARKVLAAEDGKRIARWAERVVAVPRGQPQVEARLLPAVRDAVCDALLRGRQLAVRYRSRDQPSRARQLHPLGLAVRETVTYLVATVEGFGDPRLFLLHRMSSASVVEQPARWPEGFELRGYVERELSWRFSPEKLRLALRVESAVVLGFEETPLSADQTIEPDGEEGFVVRASVFDTRELRSFLLGYGAMVEVLEPKSLRQHFAGQAKAVGRLYGPR